MSPDKIAPLASEKIPPQAQDREAVVQILALGLGVGLGGRIGQRHPSASGNFARAALPEHGARGAPFGFPGGRGPGLLEPLARQTPAGATRRPVVPRDRRPVAQFAPGLDLLDGLPAGGQGVPAWPQKIREGAFPGVKAMAAVGLAGRFGEQAGRQDGGEAFFQLRPGEGLDGLSPGLEAGAQRGQPGAPGGKERRRFPIGRYIYRPIDTSASLGCMKSSAGSDPQARYAPLRQTLARTGWLSEGDVQDRGPGAGGSHYQWTRKVKGKTVSVALSQAQDEALREAIARWRRVQATLQEMQRLSRGHLFATLPHPKRRKHQGKKVLGTK